MQTVFRNNSGFTIGTKLLLSAHSFWRSLSLGLSIWSIYRAFVLHSTVFELDCLVWLLFATVCYYDFLHISLIISRLFTVTTGMIWVFNRAIFIPSRLYWGCLRKLSPGFRLWIFRRVCFFTDIKLEFNNSLSTILK